MVRFSAEEGEIAALVRFLSRRSPGGLWMLPLEADHRGDLRFRRTPRPFLNRLYQQDAPLSWGLLPFPDSDHHAGKGNIVRHPVAVPRRGAARTSVSAPSAAKKADDPRLRIDPDASGLIVLALGPVSGPGRRRDGILLTRDPLPGVVSASGNLPLLSDEASDARAELVEKCARRLRRKGERRGGRWHV